MKISKDVKLDLEELFAFAYYLSEQIELLNEELHIIKTRIRDSGTAFHDLDEIDEDDVAEIGGELKAVDSPGAHPQMKR